VVTVIATVDIQKLEQATGNAEYGKFVKGNLQDFSAQPYEKLRVNCRMQQSEN